MSSTTLRFPGGPALRDARRRAGYSLTEVAARIGRTAETVSLWEAGRHRPPQHCLDRLSALVGVDAAELRGGRDGA